MNRVKADICNKLKLYFRNLPVDVSGTNMCVCLSGGADSVALLRAMLMIAEDLGVTVKSCHFNHGIRGLEADEDEVFCKNLCKELSVEIYCGRDNVPAFAKLNKMSLEEAARDRRYAFFERISYKDGVDYCLTAHNMNDDAETLLFNLIRGSGSNGASSIAPFNLFILRPMLKITREEIESFLQDIGQSYVVDSTNVSDEYTRNYIRHNVIPAMQKINPSVVTALSRYTQSCRDDRDYFNQIVFKNYDVDLRKLHKAVRKRVLIEKAHDCIGIKLNSDMIERIEKALFSGRRHIVPLTSNTEALIAKGIVNYAHKVEDEEFEFSEEILMLGHNEYFSGRISLDITENNSYSLQTDRVISKNVITLDNVVGTVRVRNRRIGDKICIRGINRSLKKMLIDKKIPREYRHIIPIIFDDQGILYIPFIGIADRAYPSDKTKNYTVISTLETINKERWSNAYEE